jgi:hypothetical protein
MEEIERGSVWGDELRWHGEVILSPDPMTGFSFLP